VLAGTIAATRSLVLAAAAAPSGVEGAAERPLRALLLLGGEYHAFEANADLLVRSLERELGAGALAIDRIRIDRRPEGQPTAEPARTPNRQELLADRSLREKYDLVIAYTQDAHVALTPDERDGWLAFVRGGGGFVGIHCASDTLKSDPEYVAMVGGRFAGHPPEQKLRIERTEGDHPVLEEIADFEVEDEFYLLEECRLDDKSVLLSGRNPADGKLRPAAWTKRYGDGRVFYTALGHGPATFVHASFRRLIANAVRWVATPGERRDGSGAWILFDGAGARPLEGWTMTGPGSFTVEEDPGGGGRVLVPHGGMGLLWYSRRAFRDFVLELEFRLDEPTDNSGVYVRFPPPFNPWSAVDQGYEIQICDAGGEMSCTGSVYSFAPPTVKAWRPAGEWNRYRITVQGQRYVVELNGTRVCDYTGSRARAGHVGLQNHDDESMVRFRNVRVTELAE